MVRYRTEGAPAEANNRRKEIRQRAAMRNHPARAMYDQLEDTVSLPIAQAA